VSQDNDQKKRELVGFLGVGMDSTDGHQRLTRARHFFLVGGSAETHEHMQDTATRFNEALDRKGRSLSETAPDEAVDLLREALGL